MFNYFNLILAFCFTLNGHFEIMAQTPSYFLTQQIDEYGNHLTPDVYEDSKMVWSVSSDGKTLQMKQYDVSDNGKVSWELLREIYSIEKTDSHITYVVSDNRGGKVSVVFTDPNRATKQVKTVYEDGGYVIHTGNIDYSLIFN